ncbi:MAG TPA: 2-phosphosulfolactate phosphatase [Methylomirabilota bacterium]
MRIDVVPTVEAVAPSALAGVVVLVVDVLRASTTMITALAHGCAGIVPVIDADEARRRAAALKAGSAVLAGERQGETIPGFVLGNSPLEVSAERVGGRTLVFTTSNGTRALLAARSAAAVGVAAFVNLSAAAAWARAGGRDVTVLCAGERGRISLEDHVCAGLLVERLAGPERDAQLSPRAHDAVTAGASYASDVARLARASSWARRLADRGRGGDVAACLALDTTTLVPVYQPDVDKVVSPPR